MQACNLTLFLRQDTWKYSICRDVRRMIVLGKPILGMKRIWLGKYNYCSVSTATKGPQSDPVYGDDIAVQCCDSLGQAYRPDCVRGVDYYTALAHCESYGFRLCSYDDVSEAIWAMMPPNPNGRCLHLHYA